jgi:hypothetical protein
MTDECVVVGVTGHRRVEDANALRTRVRFALLMLSQRTAGSARHPAAINVLSAIAEGADRLVAQEVLKLPNSSLEVVLPFARADYETDFETNASKMEFASLIHQARSVRELPAGATRDEGYENAGRAIVDAADVIIAIWDGQPSRGRGGTAEIVEYARDHGKEVVWIESQAPHSIHDEGAGSATAELKDLNAYLGHELSEDAVREQMQKQRGWWAPSDPARASELPLQEMMDWILPDFVRADMLALHYQKRHEFVSTLMYVLPVIAVLAVTTQALFASEHPWIVLFEIGALTGLLFLFLASRRTRLHGQWISYRFLAERLRSSYYLAVIASSDQRRDRSEVVYLDDPSDEWIRLMLAEVNSRRPPVTMTPSYVKQARDYLAENWIRGQAAYHRSASARNERRERRFQWTIGILFALALGVAIVHTALKGEHAGDRPWWSSALIQLSIVVPVLGAALHGIGTQREFKRHAQRYERMAKLLDNLCERLCEANDAETLKHVASDVERLIRDENSDWFGVMRFHDVELIT